MSASLRYSSFGVRGLVVTSTDPPDFCAWESIPFKVATSFGSSIVQ